MKRFATGLSVIAAALTLTGCAQSISQEVIDNYSISTADLSAVFPANLNVTEQDSYSQLIPCSTDELIEASGAKSLANQEFDSRISTEDPTYYRVSVITYASIVDFGELKKSLEEAVQACNHLNDQTFGDVSNFSSEKTKIGVRDLEKFGLVKNEVFQYSNEQMKLVVNKKTLYTDGALEKSETFIVHAGEKLLLLTVKGRNYKDNSADFPYLEAATVAALGKFSTN